MVKSAAAMLAVVAAMGLAGCGDTGGSSSDGKVQAVASFYPLYEATRAVGGELVDVTNLTAAGVEPHDVELTSRQVDAIEDADVVLYLGHGFQPAVEKAGKRAKTAVDLLATDGLTLLSAPEGHDEEQGKGHEAGEGEDPHVWLDPSRMIRVVERIRTVLAEEDPANAGTYAANAKAFTDRLQALDADFRSGLGSCQRRRIVTSHAAFTYLADRYDLRQEAIAGLAPESEPNPRRLAELTDQVKADGTTTIFYETLVSPRVAEALAREARVTTAVLNPLEGLTTEEVAAGESYESVMRRNLQALRSALGCN